MSGTVLPPNTFFLNVLEFVQFPLENNLKQMQVILALQKEYIKLTSIPVQ